MNCRTNIPPDNDIFVEETREYLMGADMSGLTIDDAAIYFHASVSSLQYRFHQAGTSWQRLKHEEKVRRLREILDRPGRPDLEEAATACGYAEIDGVLRLFQREMGHTMWRTARQAF